MKSINPANNQVIHEYTGHTSAEAESIISSTHDAWLSWKSTTFQERTELMHKAADVLQENKETYAGLITAEMGKLIGEARAEIDKCTLICRYYADNAENMLADEVIKTDYSKSFVAFQPLGVVLAVMPWNFPFWQVLRFAAPALMAGNAAVLKHASNVFGSALKIEEVFAQAGFPKNLFRTLLISSGQVADVITNPFVKAVTLTGSEPAGSKVAETAGRELKKSVLELGGSDPFLVMEDADLDLCATTSIKARTGNCGQTCIAAKRFIVVETVAKEFEEQQKRIIESLVVGDPMDDSTQLAPMARPDLVDELHAQVEKSIALGARLVAGGKKLDLPGSYYAPTILADVKKGMPAYDEETFGPVSAIITVRDEAEAIVVANDSRYGLGGSVWTKDTARGERIARQIETGTVVVNNMTVSNPRLPFGGIKKSGYGRELSYYGIKEFCNIKTICIQ